MTSTLLIERLMMRNSTKKSSTLNQVKMPGSLSDLGNCSEKIPKAFGKILGSFEANSGPIFPKAFGTKSDQIQDFRSKLS